MPSDLAQHIQQLKVMDTHEHMGKEPDWVGDTHQQDVLRLLFDNYCSADLVSAGASHEAVQRAMDASNPDVEGRWSGIEKAWSATRFTGNGEAVRLIAKNIFDMDEITSGALRSAEVKVKALRQPGQRLHILRELAGLDHIQTDDFCWPCVPDKSGPDFFLYDITWCGFCCGEVQVEPLAKETGVTVHNLASLRQAMAGIFDKYGSCAIAVKSQHAYHRTLRWVERSDDDAQRALDVVLGEKEADEQVRLCLGDWAMARGVELAGEHHLPFKIHTGYYAGNNHMITDRIHPGHLCPLLIRYTDTRFVLMHIAYPYDQELIAMAKHFPHVWADLCWAWSINPLASAQFVRNFIHGAPINKLFAFGGDTQTPTSSYAYAIQMRRYLTDALQGEVDDGYLCEAEAIEIVTRLTRDNQIACFDLNGTRTAIHEATETVCA